MTSARVLMYTLLFLSLALTGAAAAQEAPETTPQEDKVVEGIDVSHFQGAIDWPTVEGADIRFAYIKATQGTKWVDPRFAENWSGVARTGIRRGAYHFLEPDVDGTAQAKHFLKTVELKEGDLLPVVDVETKGPNLRVNLEKFLTEVKRQTKLDAMIYVAPAFWNDHLETSREEPWPNPLWIAEYGVSTPRAAGSLGPWLVWQYEQDGRVPGITGPVDRDRARRVHTEEAPAAPSKSN